jgi:hypothetical protein
MRNQVGEGKRRRKRKNRETGQRQSAGIVFWKPEPGRVVHCFIGLKGRPGVSLLEVVGTSKLQVIDYKWDDPCAWLNFFGFLWLALLWKQNQKLRKLSVINHILVILGQLLQKFTFSFLDCHLGYQSNLWPV